MVTLLPRRRVAPQRATFRVPELSQIHQQPQPDDLVRFWRRIARTRRPEVKLLKQHLSDWQMAEAKRTGFIPVVGSKGGTWVVQIFPESLNMYRIYLDDDGREKQQARHRCLVFTHDDQMPPLDWVIGKVLLLEADEGRVERVAN